jgi:hypothetical protein
VDEIDQDADLDQNLEDVPAQAGDDMSGFVEVPPEVAQPAAPVAPMTAEPEESTGLQRFVAGVRERANKLFPSAPNVAQTEPPQPLSDMQKLAFDNAVRSGFITPENYQQEISKLVTTPGLQQTMKNLAEQRFGIGSDVLEQERQQEIAPLVKGTPAEVPGVNTVRAPVQDVAADAAAKAAAQAGEAELAAQKIAQDEQLQVQAEKAEQRTQARAAQKEVAAQAKAEAKVALDDQRAQVDVPRETPEEGLSMRQAFAVLLGGISQGLTGAKENPAMAMIEAINERRMKRIEQEAKQKQWSEEHKLAVQKAELDRQATQANIARSNVQNELTKAQIDATMAKGEKLRADIEARQKVANLGQTRGLTVQELNQLPAETKATYALNPFTNTFFPTTGRRAADEVRAAVKVVKPAISELRKLQDLNKKYGNNYLAKAAAFNDRGAAQTIRQGLIGFLRLPYLGPGVITDAERELMENMIAASPVEILTLASTNEAKLQQIRDKVITATKAEMEAAGMPVVKSDADRYNEALMRETRKFLTGKDSKMTDEELKQGLIERGSWKFDIF